MSVIADIEDLALGLSDSKRAKLAEKLIASLPGPSIKDGDDDIAEAIRRSREMIENPEISISIEELDERIRKRFPTIVSDKSK